MENLEFDGIGRVKKSYNLSKKYMEEYRSDTVNNNLILKGAIINTVCNSLVSMLSKSQNDDLSLKFLISKNEWKSLVETINNSLNTIEYHYINLFTLKHIRHVFVAHLSTGSRNGNEVAKRFMNDNSCNQTPDWDLFANIFDYIIRTLEPTIRNLHY